MITKEISKSRGRPRGFDTEAALDMGQALFHRHGYEAVGMAALTEALGIKPPSFYAAFGSKAAFFAQVMERYSRNALPIDTLLRAGRPPAQALGELLEAAARLYAADCGALGCLVVEAARGSAEVAEAARKVKDAARERMRAFVAATHPRAADAVADLMVVTTGGMSAAAREAWGEARLMAVARGASLAIAAMLGD